MSEWESNLRTEANTILTTEWDARDGRVVPDSEDVTLSNGAVKIQATFLYADLAGSSVLAQTCPWNTTAKIIRAYLHCATRLIRGWGGHVRSFDGDRVMGVFIGNAQAGSAAGCGREIYFATEYILNPIVKKQFKSIQDADIHIKQCVGIDTGNAIAVRAGIRASNDLAWIGRAPSLAAKLSDIRHDSCATFVSADTYKKLPDAHLNAQGQHIWREFSHTFGGKNIKVYGSSWWKRP